MSNLSEAGSHKQRRCAINSKLPFITVLFTIICTVAMAYSMGQIIQVAQLSQRDRALQGALVLAKSG